MQERYARDIIFALQTRGGLYLFGLNRQPPDAIVANDLARYNSLLSVGNIDLRSAPLGPDLIAALAAAEQSTLDVVCSNVDQRWSKLICLEPVLGAMGEIRPYFASGKMPLLYRGKVGVIELSKHACRLQLREP